MVCALNRTNVKYGYDVNRGRAHALKDAIMMADCEYTMIMDSDDYFLTGALESVLKILVERKFDAYLFPIVSSKGMHTLEPGIKNFIRFRVEDKIKYDLKEIVSSNHLKDVLYHYDNSIRRVPTGMLWHRLSFLDCQSICIPIIYKNYLDDGMTKNISSLKKESLPPIQDYYNELITSEYFTSYRFRCLAAIKLGFYKGKCSDVRVDFKFCVLVGRLISKCRK
jgi:glycosyltransferase involved in cell wall biosynthesis